MYLHRMEQFLVIGTHVICACLFSFFRSTSSTRLRLLLGLTACLHVGNSCHRPSDAIGICLSLAARRTVCHSFWVRFVSFWHSLLVGEPAHLRDLSCRTCVASLLLFLHCHIEHVFFGSCAVILFLHFLWGSVLLCITGTFQSFQVSIVRLYFVHKFISRALGKPVLVEAHLFFAGAGFLPTLCRVGP